MKCPCKGCTDRHECCWSTCRLYQAYRAFCEEREARRADNTLVNRHIYDSMTKSFRRRHERKGK